MGKKTWIAFAVTALALGAAIILITVLTSAPGDSIIVPARQVMG